MTDDLKNRTGAERTVSLAVSAAMGVTLGLTVSDQSWEACILWSLVGCIAVVPIVMGATRAARYVAKRRSTR
ncbi:hypothetical protein DMH18_11240 [Streptomyces sp. WAC 06783]|uniref:hypothetical protein n=1 Tax=unclassified Streptomyces TaxID=2593676 RepID=UPI000F74444E|nr:MULTISPECIES: hypothetical protein [unclassified Streptomyces]RSO10728.1 hypothetical protein DMH18_11240 [Streptomyces sp. WAC 06783]RSO48587.1 hypothetical protein DMH15_04200 [Streptomyces sp. WAC 06725]